MEGFDLSDPDTCTTKALVGAQVQVLTRWWLVFSKFKDRLEPINKKIIFFLFFMIDYDISWQNMTDQLSPPYDKWLFNPGVGKTWTDTDLKFLRGLVSLHLKKVRKGESL